MHLHTRAQFSAQRDVSGATSSPPRNMAPECKGMLRLYTLKDLHERGITYTRQHLRRLEVKGKIPPLHRRAPGCRTFFTDEHLVALTGRKPEAQALPKLGERDQAA